MVLGNSNAVGNMCTCDLDSVCVKRADLADLRFKCYKLSVYACYLDHVHVDPVHLQPFGLVQVINLSLGWHLTSGGSEGRRKRNRKKKGVCGGRERVNQD